MGRLYDNVHMRFAYKRIANRGSRFAELFPFYCSPMTVYSISGSVMLLLLASCVDDATLAANEGGASAALRIHERLMSLRAGVTVAVIAEIGSRSRIVGTIGLHAVGN
jgi:hypothetical protein